MTLQERFAKLEPRERTLVLILGAMMGLGIVLGGPLYFLKQVWQVRAENQEMHEYLEKVADQKTKIAEKKAARDQVLTRYAKTVPATFIEDAAKQNQVEVSETQKKPDIPHGKKFIEHVQSLQLRKVGLVGLTKMLERVENGGYPVSVTRFNMKPRGGEPDSYDVEVGISSFERKPDAPKKDDKSGASPSASASADPGDL